MNFGTETSPAPSQSLFFLTAVFPLYSGKADIPALVNYFIERKVREMKLKYRPVPAPGEMERLRQYDWPGNVRELENTVERELIRSQAKTRDAPLRFSVISECPFIRKFLRKIRRKRRNAFWRMLNRNTSAVCWKYAREKYREKTGQHPFWEFIPAPCATGCGNWG